MIHAQQDGAAIAPARRTFGLASAVTLADLLRWRCPVNALTGYHCPGCGAQRSVRWLLRGDVAGALRNNALLPVAVTVIVWMAITDRRARRLQQPPRSHWGIISASALLIAVFVYLRNRPGSRLAPITPLP